MFPEFEPETLCPAGASLPDRSGVCGRIEYFKRAEIDTSSLNKRMNDIERSFNDTCDDLHRAVRKENRACKRYMQAREEQRKGKSGSGGWIFAVIAAIVIIFLLGG